MSLELRAPLGRGATPPQAPATAAPATTGTATGPGSAVAGWLVPVAAVGLLIALVVRYSALRLGNQDTWFHLVLGDRFRHGAGLAHPAGLTPFATSGWVPTQWSTEVAASAVTSAFGLPGLAWLFGTAYVALVVCCYLGARRFGGAGGSAVAVTLVVFGSASVLSARPQIVSLLLLIVVVAAWLRTADDGRLRWWLIPMTWLWATAHGLWSAGVLLGLVAVLGLALDRRLSGRRLALGLAIPVGSVAAAALTPVGPRLLASQVAVSARTSMIPEWGATDFRSVSSLCVAAMVALVLLVWVRRGQRSWTRILLLLLAAGWLVMVSRLVPFAAVVVAPLLAEALSSPAGSHSSSTVPAGRRERSTVLAMGAVAVLALALAAPRLVTAPADVPNALGARLDALPAGSTLLVEDGVGGWVEWRSPGVHPVIDGMLDAYPVDYIRRFFATTRVEPGWRSFVSDSGARAGILHHGSALTTALEHELGWREVSRAHTPEGDWVFLEAPAASTDQDPTSPH